MLAETARREGVMAGMRKLLAAAAAVLLALSAAAAAQDYPNRPVRLVVPFPPGGINDIVARVLAQHLGERLGKQVIVDNRGGAGGVVGSEIVANAPKDGHTLLIVSLASAVNPWLYTLPYDPAEILRPGRHAGRRAERRHRQSGPAGQQHQGAGRARQAKARRTAIRILRRRHVPASGRRAVQDHRRRRHSAHPVPRRGSGADRRGRPATPRRRSAR